MVVGAINETDAVRRIEYKLVDVQQPRSGLMGESLLERLALGDVLGRPEESNHPTVRPCDRSPPAVQPSHVAVRADHSIVGGVRLLYAQGALDVVPSQRAVVLMQTGQVRLVGRVDQASHRRCGTSDPTRTPCWSRRPIPSCRHCQP